MLASWYARKLTGLDVSIFYDGTWIHRLETHHIADSLRFEYHRDRILAFKSQHEKTLKESGDYWLHVYKPQPGDVVIDVGAGIGSDTALFSRAVGASGKVIAIEAHPLTYRVLEKQCKWQRLTNVVSMPYAIMDKRCTVYIENQPVHEVNAVSVVQGPEHLSESIPGFSLDEVCAVLGITCVDFLKMNIEGAERFAIIGMKKTIANTRYASIACHGGQQYSTKELVVDFLQRNDFDVVSRESDPRPYVRDHVHGIRRGGSVGRK